MMRILMLNNEFPPLGGGTGTVNRALLERWSREPELEIDLITSALDCEFHRRQFAKRVRIFYVPVSSRNLHHSSNRELISYGSLATVLALRLFQRAPYELVFAWSTVPAGAVALFLNQFVGLPFLVRVCGPDIPGFERRYALISAVLKPLIAAALRRAGAVVAKCEQEAAMIRAIEPRVGVTVIPNGVDLAAFTPPERDLQPGRLRIVCVARLIERKGHPQLFEAVRQLSNEHLDVTLDLVGTGDAEEEYRKQVRHLGIETRVRFNGYVPREEIAKHYHASDVFVLASFNEGMSVATLEAMAAGLPVVVTRTGGSRELVEEGKNGFVFEWGDVDRLVKHLRFLGENPETARAMGEASRERAAWFSWDAPAEQYLELFYRLRRKPRTVPIQPLEHAPV